MSPLEIMRAIAALRGTSGPDGDRRVTAVHKAVLYALALRADNETGRCWPSLGTLATDAGVSRSCVKSAVQALIELGHISKITRRREGVLEADSNVYTIHVGRELTHVGHELTEVGQELPHLPGRHETDVGQEQADGGPAGDLGVGHDVTGGRAPGDLELPIELPKGTTNGTATPPAVNGKAPPALKLEPTDGRSQTKKPMRSTKAKVEAVFHAWVREGDLRNPKRTRKPVLDRKRRWLIASWVERYDVEFLICAVRGIWHTPWNVGVNNKGAEYTGIELALRDAAHIERFAANAPASLAPSHAPRIVRLQKTPNEGPPTPAQIEESARILREADLALNNAVASKGGTV